MLKNWFVIAGLGVVGLALVLFAVFDGAFLSGVPEGVTPQGDTEAAVTTIAALAGAITTLGGAIFGVLGKYNDFRKARLDIAAQELALEQQRRDMGSR